MDIVDITTVMAGKNTISVGLAIDFFYIQGSLRNSGKILMSIIIWCVSCCEDFCNWVSYKMKTLRPYIIYSTESGSILVICYSVESFYPICMVVFGSVGK